MNDLLPALIALSLSVAAMSTARAGALLDCHIGSYREGGWVAPLAANRTAVDFVIVCFGLAVNVIDEDQEGVELRCVKRAIRSR